MLGLVKGGLKLLAGFGVGLIVDQAVDIFKPRNLKGVKNIAVKVGGIAMSMMIADKVSDYVGEVFDETQKSIQEMVTIEEVTEEKVEETEEN